MHKLAVGRDLLTESAMASQPTRLQCENVAGPRPVPDRPDVGYDGKRAAYIEYGEQLTMLTWSH